LGAEAGLDQLRGFGQGLVGFRGIIAAADDIIGLREVEGLDAHARSVKIRRQG